MRALANLHSAATDSELQAVLDSIPYLRFLGVKVQRQGEGLAFTLEFSEALVGNTRLPALHGGAIGAFLETAALVQLLWTGNSPWLPKTINFQIEYLRSGKAEDTFARATVRKQGRRVAYVAVDAWQSEPTRPIATGTGNFLMPRESPSSDRDG